VFENSYFCGNIRGRSIEICIFALEFNSFKEDENLDLARGTS
jgi:hypothetical protein